MESLIAFCEELAGIRPIKIQLLQPYGDLIFYKDLARNGTFNWANNGRGQRIGTGWNSFKFVFGGEDGVIRAILP